MDKGINLPSGRGALGHGIKKSTSRSAFVPGAGRGRGRGRGALKNQSKKDFHLSKNGTGKKFTSEIKILPTERLLKEVCFLQTYSSLLRVIPSSHISIFLYKSGGEGFRHK